MARPPRSEVGVLGFGEPVAIASPIEDAPDALQLRLDIGALALAFEQRVRSCRRGASAASALSAGDDVSAAAGKLSPEWTWASTRRHRRPAASARALSRRVRPRGRRHPRSPAKELASVTHRQRLRILPIAQSPTGGPNTASPMPDEARDHGRTRRPSTRSCSSGSATSPRPCAPPTPSASATSRRSSRAASTRWPGSVAP